VKTVNATVRPMSLRAMLSGDVITTPIVAPAGNTISFVAAVKPVCAEAMVYVMSEDARVV
jgi:hypothetical protein